MAFSFNNTTCTSCDNAEADDFVVPAGQVWHVTEVDATGTETTNNPPFSEIVTFYKNGHGHPGRIAGRGADTFTLNCTDNSGSFACSIPNGVTLRGGRAGRHYWVSVVANCDQGCNWEWSVNNVTHNDPGQWEKPGGGFLNGKCRRWTDTSQCVSSDAFADDVSFDLQGF